MTRIYMRGRQGGLYHVTRTDIFAPWMRKVIVYDRDNNIN